MSFNAWGLPAPFAPARAHRLAEAAAWLQSTAPDVVALQEVWKGAAPLLPLDVSRSSEPGDDGLALHTSHRLAEVDTLRFHRARGFDALKRKGALRARVELEGAAVWVVSTHLQSGYGAANAAVREAQVTELLTWLAPLTEPVVLAGDFNLDDLDTVDGGTVALLSEAGFVDAALATKAALPTYPGDGRRYDRVLLRGGLTFDMHATGLEVVSYDDNPETSAPIRLSDHRPVIAHLRLVPHPQLDSGVTP
jgi:endonuclease/exonuclease/phosphatase family metal-dependent hydrolase